jgi:uncharacterized surface protein with fasciclin (FAS1) repeats
MPPSDRDRPARSGRIVAAIAALAVLGLILAVLIASCAGDDDTAGQAAPAETEQPATATSEPAETDTPEPEPAEVEDQATTGTDQPATDVETSEQDGPATVVDAAAEAGELGTLVSLLERSTLDTTLADGGPYTVFAPTDEAFDALPDELLTALEDDPTALKQLLTYHVVADEVPPEALVAGSLATLEGAPLEIAERAGRQYAADAPIVPPPVETGNGWLYPIGYVLLPPDLDLPSLVGDEIAAAAYDRANFVVFFAIGSAELDDEGRQTIVEAAAELATLPAGSVVRLVGVADPTGDAAANLELSRQRARAVQAALEEATPEADVRYVVRAKGEEEGPELANARRVDIVLSPA